MERILNNGGILVTGVTGQVGSAVKSLLTTTMPNVALHTPVRAEMDLADAASIRAYVQTTRPQWIVSSGAYTAVDAAESDRDAAWAINAIAPGVLAREAKSIGAGVLHFSTDYVFPGDGDRPWVETDATAPLNVYGASKLAGEQAISTSGAAHAILRTSWVYSATGKNFVRTMLRLLTTKEVPLRVVADQHGAPTSADDLAAVIDSMLRFLRSDPGALSSRSGVYHCAGSGETTWAGLASAIREFLVSSGWPTPPEIIPVQSSEYPTPAARPKNSRMSCTQLQNAFGITLPAWNVSLQKVLRDLAATDLVHPGFGL